MDQDSNAGLTLHVQQPPCPVSLVSAFAEVPSHLSDLFIKREGIFYGQASGLLGSVMLSTGGLHRSPVNLWAHLERLDDMKMTLGITRKANGTGGGGVHL